MKEWRIPDLDLIKQVEQVTTSALEGPWRFGRTVVLRRDSERGGHGRRRNPCISDSAITALAVICLP
jgi:hypothetical protein